MIKEGTLDPEKPFEDAVEQAIKNDPKYNIFITLTSNEDKSIFKKGKLSGIPIAVKDNISTKGIRTTCASKILEDYVPGYSATVVERIEAEGGIIFGKTNMDEFAMGALGTTSAFGPTLNNLNIELSPGGSSSGSAVAVSSGTVKLALGSDTGGSIRLPAAWTGIYGFKPTYGFVSRYGLISYADSMDQIGPLATNISDLILLFSIISGSDERDPTSQFPGINKEKMLKLAYSEADVDILKKLKLIVIKNLIEHPQADEGLINEFWKDLKMLESYGASIELIDEPLILKIPQIYYIIAFSEASSNLARFDGLRYGKRISNVEKNDYDSFYMENRTLFGWEVKRRILLGTFILSKGYYETYYVKALKARTYLRKRIDRILNEETKFIVTPGSLIRPLPLKYDARDLSKLNAVDAPLMLANLIGSPAIVIPTGFSQSSPKSLQLIGRVWSDYTLLSIAKAIELVMKHE